MAKKVSTHLFLLDFLADTPVIITIIATGAYQSEPIIFIDCVWKTALIIRSLSYYLVYQLWFDKGKKIFSKTGASTKQP